jgi:hypothetical protein
MEEPDCPKQHGVWTREAVRDVVQDEHGQRERINNVQSIALYGRA